MSRNENAPVTARAPFETKLNQKYNRPPVCSKAFLQLSREAGDL